MSVPPEQSQPPDPSETSHRHDVFFDPTGRRWRLTRAFLLLLTIFVVVVVAVSWRPVQQPPTLGTGTPAVSLRTPSMPGRAPEIGAGPLVRLVLVSHQNNTIVAIDPVTRQSLGAITGDDAAQIGNARYALQHYGYSSAAHKTLELTFDDGPDPTWTPKILDLLSKYKAPATFFVIGSEVVKYPDIVAREISQGFAVGNHTLTHPDLMPDQVAQEFGANDHVLRAVTGTSTRLVRLPYDGYGKQENGADANAIMVELEKMHYIVSVEEFDTEDWRYADPATRPKKPMALPPANVDNLTLLLHDGGGDRSETLNYLKRLLPWALAHGFTFHSLPQVSPQVQAGIHRIVPSLWDGEAFWFYTGLFSWPDSLIRYLFLLAIATIVISSGINVALAVTRRLRFRRKFAAWRDDATGPPVSIAIAAYNEETVIGRTLKSLRRSLYPNIKEIIVVDDGSIDGTSSAVSEMASKDRRIVLLRQENSGKAAALNRAFARAQADIVVTLDADTLFAPNTVGNLIRHFVYDTSNRLGAVAGVVKVGNLRNLITRWQALDYLTQIGVDRGAQDFLHAIMVVPGACAAWRREAVLRVGGYSRATLAEDCDLALDLQQSGFGVTQDDQAVCYTEVPETTSALFRQRYRWIYGNIQAMWKHRRMVLNPRYGWLGMLTLPLAALSVVLPVAFLPFVYVMAFVTFQGDGLGVVLMYIALFLLAQVLTAAVGIWLTRERPSHLLIAPVYRLIGEPLRAYVLYKSALTVLRGTQSTWQKLQRTGSVKLAEIERANDSREGATT